MQLLLVGRGLVLVHLKLIIRGTPIKPSLGALAVIDPLKVQTFVSPLLLVHSRVAKLDDMHLFYNFRLDA